MDIMCPKKFRGPRKFLRHTLDLGTTDSSPLTDPAYPGLAQRWAPVPPPHSGVLRNKLQNCTFLPTESPSCTYISLYMNNPSGTASHSHLLCRLDSDIRPHPGSHFHVPTTVAFCCIFLKIEVCDFTSSFPLFYLLNVWCCGRVFNFATTVTVSFSFFNIFELAALILFSKNRWESNKCQF
jgi:hypothetical protein